MNTPCAVLQHTYPQQVLHHSPIAAVMPACCTSWYNTCFVRADYILSRTAVVAPLGQTFPTSDLITSQLKGYDGPESRECVAAHIVRLQLRGQLDTAEASRLQQQHQPSNTSAGRLLHQQLM
jgi:hypothetical protein